MLDMIELTWQFLIITVILLFGINIGLAIGYTMISRNEILLITLLYSILTVIALTLAKIYINLLYGFINQFIPEILGIIGVLTIVSGIYTIIQWKKNKEGDYPLLSPAFLSSVICGMMGMVSTFILLGKGTPFSIELVLVLAGALFLVIMMFYLFSKVLQKAETPYLVVVSNYMILNGFYFFIAATFIPNIGTLSDLQMNPLTLSSSSSLFFLSIAGLGVLLLGVFLQNRKLQRQNSL